MLYGYDSRAAASECSLAMSASEAVSACLTSPFADDKNTGNTSNSKANGQLSLLINRALLSSASNTAQSAANALFSETNTPLVGTADGGALQRCACAFCGVCPALLAVRNQPAGGDLLRACVACVQRLNLTVLNLAVGTNALLAEDSALTPRLPAVAEGRDEQRAARHSSGATSTDSGTGGEPQSAVACNDFAHDLLDVFDSAAAHKAIARVHEAEESELRALSVSSGAFSGAASSGVNTNARGTPSKSLSSLAGGVGCANSAPQSPTAACSQAAGLAMCQRHAGEPVRMFCRTCEQLVCQYCLFSDSQPGHLCDSEVDHRQHDLQLIATAVEQQAVTMRAANQDAKCKLAEMRQMVVGLQQLSTRLVVHMQKTQTQVDDVAALMTKLVAERRAELQRSLDSAYQSRAAPIATVMQRAHEQLEKLQQLADFVDRLLVSAASPSSANRGLELLVLHKLVAGNLTSLLRDAVPDLARQFTSLLASAGNTANSPCFADLDYLVDERLIHPGVQHLLGSFRACNPTNGSTTPPNESNRTHSNSCSTDTDFVDGVVNRQAASKSSVSTANQTCKQLVNAQSVPRLASQQPINASLASQLAQLKLNAPTGNSNTCVQAEAPRPPTDSNVLPINDSQLQLQALAALQTAGVDLSRLSPAEQHALIARLRQQVELNGRIGVPLPLPQMLASGTSAACSTAQVSGTPQLRSTTKRTKMIYSVKFGEFGVMNGQFTEPSGVAVSLANEIIVADTNNHRIQVFEPDGRFKFQFGECGKRDSQLLYPNRVAVNPLNGDIVVTERSPTHQIQVYNQSGQFLRKFGANVLQHPRGVTVDKQGRILVVECKVMRILIFDQHGMLLNKFGCSKYLEFPNAIAVNDKEEIFVSDNRAHCVKVFDYSGRYLRQVGGEGVTNYPIGVAVSSSGEILVADNHNNFNLTVFNSDGEMIGALESKVKHAQCFDIALLRDASDSIVLASKDYRLYVYRYRNPTPVSD